MLAEVPVEGAGVTTSVLVVDDEALLRTAFSSLIDAEDDLEVVGQAADGRRAVELATRLSPDVVVMDVRMPVMDGIEATRQITSAARVPGAHPHDVRPRRVRLRGAAGGRERLRAEEPAARGAAERDPHRRRRRGAAGPERDAPAHRALRRPGPDPEPQEPRAPRGLAELTEREREVLALVAQGLSNAELAQTLHVSLPTAKTHVSRILTKLGARDRTQLVVLAYESGLTTTL